MTARNPGVAIAIREAMGHPPPVGSLSRLAEALGTTPSTTSRWHALQSSPDPAMWPAIERALGLDAGTLAAAAEQPVIAVDADVIDRLERLERTVLLLARQVDESIGSDDELRRLLDDLPPYR